MSKYLKNLIFRSSAFKPKNINSARTARLYAIKYITSAYNGYEGYQDHIRDFHFGENILYGRVSSSHVPIIIKDQKYISANENNIKLLKSLDSMGENVNNLKAIHFVADAFNDMVAEFRKAALDGRLDRSQAYSILPVAKAFEDPRVIYRRLLKLHHEKFMKNLDGNNYHDKILNFETFVNYYFDYTKLSLDRRPLTFSGFIKSRQCSPYVSGLSIALVNMNSSNDNQKVNSFIKSSNFCFFASAAKNYGFFIDRNEPWKLVADINSPAMKKYVQKYLKPTQKYDIVENLKPLRALYVPAHYQGFEQFVESVVMSYNSYIAKRPVVLTSYSCPSGRIKFKRIQRMPIKYEQALAIYDLKFWIEKYIDIRNQEEGNYLSSALLNRLTTDIKNLLQFERSDDIVSIPISESARAKLSPLLDRIEAKFTNVHKEIGSFSDRREKVKQRKSTRTSDQPTAVAGSTGGGGYSGGGGGGSMGGSGY
jgi:uncharacterized membrane protein YgcG